MFGLVSEGHRYSLLWIEKVLRSAEFAKASYPVTHVEVHTACSLTEVSVSPAVKAVKAPAEP